MDKKWSLLVLLLGILAHQYISTTVCFSLINFLLRHCQTEILYYHGLFRNSQLATACLGSQTQSNTTNQSFVSSHIGCGFSFAPHTHLRVCSTFGLNKKITNPQGKVELPCKTHLSQQLNWKEARQEPCFVLLRRQLNSMPQQTIMIAISYVRYSSTSIVTGIFKCFPRPDSGPAKSLPTQSLLPTQFS